MKPGAFNKAESIQIAGPRADKNYWYAPGVLPVNFLQLIALLFVWFSISAFSVQSKAEEIVIYSSDTFQPQIYLSHGKPAGIVPALFQRLSQDTGDTYQFILLPWKRAISESSAGYGGIVNFSLTKERQLLFDFSDPIYKNEVELTVLKERESEFKNVNDLKGKIFGVPLGAQFGGEFEKAVNGNLYTVDTDSQPVSRIKKLLLRRIDVAVLGQSFLKHSVKSDPFLLANQDKFIILPFPLIDDWEYLAFPKSMHMQPAIDRFNKALFAFKKTKEYQQLIDQKKSD
jgi:ABC-type amino acid transport substrate-binding protein